MQQAHDNGKTPMLLSMQSICDMLSNIRAGVADIKIGTMGE